MGDGGTLMLGLWFIIIIMATKRPINADLPDSSAELCAYRSHRVGVVT
jgi:UDP-N-acetylmuramyl pentapeptide phosphotransferase/UDP-N-acetylglucosamine-1-phosphate transferase